jgi:CubicO group peptidase (beta-lactamase class C family)
LTLEENLARIAQAPLSYVPGTSWGYSVALDAIGAVIERVTHMDLPTVVADHVGAQAQTQGPGWGFGYGGAVLVDPSLTGTPQSPGTFHWIGAYGHSWFIDPAKSLTVVALTNTTFEGMSGKFTTDVRDAAYG